MITSSTAFLLNSPFREDETLILHVCPAKAPKSLTTRRLVTGGASIYTHIRMGHCLLEDKHAVHQRAMWDKVLFHVRIQMPKLVCYSTPVMHLVKMCFPTCTSTADSGSSMMYRSASAYAARAMLIRCFWPPLRFTPFSPISVLSPAGRICVCTPCQLHRDSMQSKMRVSPCMTRLWLWKCSVQMHMHARCLPDSMQANSFIPKVYKSFSAASTSPGCDACGMHPARSWMPASLIGDGKRSFAP